MIEELRAAVERLAQQPEEAQRRVVAVVNDELDWEEHERANGPAQDAAETQATTTEVGHDTSASPHQPSTRTE